MFPKSIVTIWSNLKQLGLANPFTSADNLYLLLSSRASLKSIDLDTLFFRADSGTYRSGLHGLNNNLIDSSNGAWKDRQPRIAVREVGKSKEYWRRATITNENSSFLNGNGECPFAQPSPNLIPPGIGWILDDFDHNYKEPHIWVDEAAELEKRQVENKRRAGRRRGRERVRNS
jgi:hypothetical protein